VHVLFAFWLLAFGISNLAPGFRPGTAGEDRAIAYCVLRIAYCVLQARTAAFLLCWDLRRRS
jgi:hypothetical protein